MKQQWNRETWNDSIQEKFKQSLDETFKIQSEE